MGQKFCDRIDRLVKKYYYLTYDYQTLLGQTALHKAAAYKRRTICCMLVAAGASLLVLDGAGLSPRQLALMAEDLELAEYLKSQERFQVMIL